MKFFRNPANVAGLLYLLLAFLMALPWYIIFGLATGPQMTRLDGASEALDIFNSVESNNLVMIFWAQVVAAILSAGLACAYLFGLVRSKSVAKLLFGLSVVLAIFTLFFAKWVTALCAIAACCCCYQVYKDLQSS